MLALPGAPPGKVGQRRVRRGFPSGCPGVSFCHSRACSLTFSIPSRARSGSLHPGLISRRWCLGQACAGTCACACLCVSACVCSGFSIFSPSTLSHYLRPVVLKLELHLDQLEGLLKHRRRGSVPQLSESLAQGGTEDLFASLTSCWLTLTLLSKGLVG